MMDKGVTLSRYVRVVASMVVVGLLLGFGMHGTASAQDWTNARGVEAADASSAETSVRGDASASASRDVDALVEQSLALLDSLRGWGLLDEIDVDVLPRAELLMELQESAERDLDMTEIAAAERLLHLLGLLPPESGYLELMLAALESEVAGYYDPEVRALRILDDVGEQEALPVLVHELWHAFQDQHVGIAGFREPFERITDSTLARMALLEGDATIVMAAAMQGGLPRMQARLLATMFRQMNLPPGALPAEAQQLPPFLWQQLLFPYTHGSAFVAEVFLEGGWTLVDESYTRAPRTTREVLITSDWLDEWQPLWIEPPYLDEDLRLGTATDAAAGLLPCDPQSEGPIAGPPRSSDAPTPEPYLSDILGMFVSSELLYQLHDGDLERSEAQRLSATLRGDRLDAFAFGDDRDLLLWLAVWESEEAAREWIHAMERIHHTWARGETTRRTASGEHGERIIFLDEEHVFLLEAWGDTTLVALDRGAHLTPSARCVHTLRVASHWMREHERLHWPAALSATPAQSGPASSLSSMN